MSASVGVDARESTPVAGVLTGTSWIPRHDLDMREWLEHGRRFGILGRGVAWWIGDWLVYGNARYGERYSRAARATGYERQSLMNMVYVASRFVPARRRAALSWSHHAELAALRQDMQERWLDLAERERMSVRSLRGELRAVRRATRHAQTQVPPLAGPHAADDSATVVCPHCKSVIEIEHE